MAAGLWGKKAGKVSRMPTTICVMKFNRILLTIIIVFAVLTGITDSV